MPVAARFYDERDATTPTAEDGGRCAGGARPAYFFFCTGVRNVRAAATGLGLSAFGLRISRLLFF
jgi:hypothetical protein